MSCLPLCDDDPRVGRATWLFGRNIVLPPYWWAPPLTFSIPLIPTLVYTIATPVREHRWVVVGCGALLSFAGVSQLIACTMDPGIVPRNEEGGVPYTGDNLSYQLRTFNNVMGLFVRKEDIVKVVTIGGEEVPVVWRWCHTCKRHRPPRAAHCTTLNCCVAEYDHFCPVLNSCVAQRTMRYFVMYLFSVSALGGWIVGTCYHLAVRRKAVEHDPNGKNRMMLMASVGLGAGVQTLLFALYYVKLISSNHTKREATRGLTNPYAARKKDSWRSALVGGCTELVRVLCGPIPASQLYGEGLETPEGPLDGC
eukprot:Sspe_Gene.28662::Locus_13131_Transcript_1_1_Confidence_1.000_Length_1277::g.28662::m.28662/K16675/ZDHHC9_14_18; palmitoyltransferase ZDHHC9/14/18